MTRESNSIKHLYLNIIFLGYVLFSLTLFQGCESESRKDRVVNYDIQSYIGLFQSIYLDTSDKWLTHLNISKKQRDIKGWKQKIKPRREYAYSPIGIEGIRGEVIIIRSKDTIDMVRFDAKSSYITNENYLRLVRAAEKFPGFIKYDTIAHDCFHIIKRLDSTYAPFDILNVALISKYQLYVTLESLD